MPWVSLSELVKQTSFAERTLRNIRNDEPHVLVTRERGNKIEYLQPDCAANLLRRERELGKKEAKPASVEEARARKIEAEAQIAELDLAERRGRVIATETHEEIVGQVCDRLRAVLLNVPGEFSPKLERCGVEAQKAEEILEEISTELTLRLQNTADDFDALATAEEGADGDSAPTPAA
jgi:phage terminase Nu1 subunit (DNA packaging protein)